jgi:flagellar export protein FliJ
MRPPDSLRVVLAVRRLKEETEERTLAALGQQIQQATIEAERLGAELASVTASRLEEVNCLLNGVHHQRSDARYRQVQKQHSEALSRVANLEKMRVEQMVIYLAARCGREVISELRERRTSAYQADLRMREQKRNDDLFLSRRARS